MIAIRAGDGICYEISGGSEFPNVLVCSKRETEASVVERVCNAINYWTTTRISLGITAPTEKIFGLSPVML